MFASWVVSDRKSPFVSLSLYCFLVAIVVIDWSSDVIKFTPPIPDGVVGVVGVVVAVNGVGDVVVVVAVDDGVVVAGDGVVVAVNCVVGVVGVVGIGSLILDDSTSVVRG